uniref:MFS_1_like domain-containing protein n=1 Tax=Caenorhabditis tropicalis TaxID=1561998 RepID=A0A1I7UUU3_9PELO
MENHVGERTVNIFGKVFPRDAFICRLFYLSFFASFGSLFPLLAVYFKQLGMTAAQVCNYNEDNYGILVSPPHSTRVYRQPAVEQAFMLLLILICLCEFFSSPALPLADAATLHAVRDNPAEFGKIRLMASVGWGLAMFIMGIALDYSDTFRNHPCPAENTTEKNYTLCFVMCVIFMLAAMGLASKFKFDDDVPAPGEVHGLVMDTREGEVSHVVAEKARARVTQSEGGGGSENSLLLAMKALASMHILLFFISVVVMGGGAGLVFSFLYWHLQDIGGSPVLFGILSVVNHASEIITYFYTFKIINKYGHVRVMYLCLAVNFFRFMALSILDNPWMVLPLQVLQGACLATVWSCASSYISLVAPPHAKQHAQYALQVGYHGIGKGIGSIVGGSVISVIGSRTTFVIYGLICLVTCAGSFGLNKLFKYEGIKYGAGNFEEEDMDIMAPQGVPMARDGKITDAFNATTVVNANYGAIAQEDPTQDAYDRYVSTTR